MSKSAPCSPSDIFHHDISQDRQITLDSLPATPENLEMTKLSIFTDRPQTNSLLSRQTSSSSSNTHNTSSVRSTHTGYRAVKRDVRALPTWVKTYDEDETDNNYDTPTTTILIGYPNTQIQSRVSENQQQSSGEALLRVSLDGYIDTYDDNSSGINDRKLEMGFFGGHREPVRGRKWDHARDSDPVIVQTRVLQRILPWRTYIESSTYRPILTPNSAMINNTFLSQQSPRYQIPWRGDLKVTENSESHSGFFQPVKPRKSFMRRIQFHILMHPLVPLLFRVIVLTTSVVALAIATSVHHLSIKYHYVPTPSSTMAIVVDVVAIPYILYITWDEYTGKPLGLRAPGAKIRLVLLDLFFIIFESANLALSFGALADDNGSCESSVNGYNYIICNRVKALCGVLMIALYGWSLTFAISIFRLVQRVVGKEED